MKIKDKIAIITGATSGIGKGLVKRFAAEGAKGLVLADINGDGVKTATNSLGATGMACDVRNEDQVQFLVATAERVYWPVDIFCSNVGILRLGDENQPDEEILDSFQINTVAHIYAARAAHRGWRSAVAAAC
ncbi:MAG: SDR family NAD(P)-dependent oxidoreductase [Rhodospirillaceae bacterium]|nr:SDR family NAD(P)-dependent oxidoreductase [Rhodospirillaceae bacterium]